MLRLPNHESSPAALVTHTGHPEAAVGGAQPLHRQSPLSEEAVNVAAWTFGMEARNLPPRA